MNSSKYKVSVILVSYNNEPFLSEAIESVLNQTLRPYEIIICDDGSTDDSWQTIKTYHSKYPDLIIPHRHRNLGVAGNLNSGLELARGDLVTCVAGDDRYLPEKIEFELETFERHPEAALVFSNFYFIDEGGRRIGLWAEGRPPPTGYIFKETFGRRWPHGSLYKGELLDLRALKQVGFYDENLRIFEDWDLRIRITSQFKVAYCPLPLAEYRIHQTVGLQRATSRSFKLSMMKIVYDKNRHLLENLSEKDRSNVERRLSNIFLRLEALVALEEGQRSSALKKYIAYLRRNITSLTAWVLAVRFILPDIAYELITRGNKRARFLLRTTPIKVGKRAQ